MPDLNIPGWLLGAVLALLPGVVVALVAHQELDSVTMAIVAGATTVGSVTALLGFITR